MRLASRPLPTMPRASLRRRLRQAALAAFVLAVLALVFASYFSPDMLFTLANQVWGCF